MFTGKVHMITAKLNQAINDKSWSLQFIGVPKDEVLRANIWYMAEYFGNFYHINPFKQGDHGDWIMIEYHSSAQCYILEAAISTCDHLNIPLDIG